MADALISKNKHWFVMPNKERVEILTELLDLVEQNSFDTQNMNETNLIVNTENILGQIESNRRLERSLTFPNNEKLIQKLNERVVVNVREAKKDQKFFFMVYENLELFFNSTINEKDQIVNQTKDNQNKNEKQTLNSHIISFKMNNADDINYLKEEPIELTFKHLSPINPSESDDVQTKVLCSFWDYNKKYVNKTLIFRFLFSTFSLYGNIRYFNYFYSLYHLDHRGKLFFQHFLKF
jgi:uncharacterized lipoprotein